MASSVSPLRRTAWRTITASNQPGRRRRPVLVPYSWPRSTRASPIVVEQLGGERARADPGDVGLGHAHHPLDVAGADAGADAGPRPATGLDEVTKG